MAVPILHASLPATALLVLYSIHCSMERSVDYIIRLFAYLFPGATKSSKRQYLSRKLVIVIVLFCGVLTSLAFLASMICYICRKNKFSGQSPSVSSDRESSWHSSANLINRKSSVSQSKISISSSVSGELFFTPWKLFDTLNKWGKMNLYFSFLQVASFRMFLCFVWADLKQSMDRLFSSHIQN